MPRKNDRKIDVAVKDPDAPSNGFITVGIGASAGGVDPLKRLFAGMPADSGMAFVVVLHLSPEHESHLAEILRNQTSMPVEQVNGPVKLRPNSVYVIPPDKNLLITDGLISVTEREQRIGPRVAIDLLFRTLADSYGRNGVGIVLSGTGADGTLGLKQIKERNGFAIVQDPDEAEYDGMPRSAISTKLVDWILPVAEMPGKLTFFKQSSQRLNLTKTGNGHDVELKGTEDLRQLLTLIRQKTGHDFTNYKRPTLLRRIARHLQIHELEDIGQYLYLLRDKPDDIQSLVKNLLINVTNFFRDTESFEALEKEVIPRLFANKTGSDTVRVWSAACASGEEAYSLGILLFEYAEHLPDPPKLQIFATDVDEDSIAEARSHSYPETIEADVSHERLNRFFKKQGGRYVVRKALREIILFAPHNLLHEPPFSRLDLLVCRNLLIYLNQRAQEQLIKVFSFALNENGYLVLGSSESADTYSDLFKPVMKKHRIYACAAAIHAKEIVPLFSPNGQFRRTPVITLPRPEIARLPASFGAIHHKLVEIYAPPSILISDDFEILHMSSSVGRFLYVPPGEPTKDLLKVIHPDILPDLRMALFSTRQDGRISEFNDIPVDLDGARTRVNISVRNAGDAGTGVDLLLVVIHESSTPGENETDEQRDVRRDRDEAVETVTRHLDTELQRTKKVLQQTTEKYEVSVEELKASNEELQAINEELRSATEELETSKEELQSVNEELTTVNQQLKEKVDEIGGVNSDLQNLMASSEIGTIFLGRDLSIKRFTPLISELFNIIPSDIGRPIEHITHKLAFDDLPAEASMALETLTRTEREIETVDGRALLLRIHPYRTLEDKINGVVLTFIDITERKASEASLRESEQRYRTLFNSIDEGFCIIDLLFDDRGKPSDYRFLEYNPMFEKLTGMKNAAGKTVRELLPDTDKETIARYGRAALNQEPVRFEVHSARLARWFEVHASPVGDESKSKIALVFTDITQRKLSEAALRESEERFRHVASAAPVLIWMADVTGNGTWFNNQWLEFTGKTSEEEMGDGWAKNIHPDDSDRFVKTYYQAFDVRQPFSMEYRLLRHDGEYRWLLDTGAPRFASGGEFLGYIGSCIDITERKNAEMALIETQDRFEFAQSAGNVGVWDWNAETEHVNWSDSMWKIYGLDPAPEKLNDELWKSILAPEERSRVSEKISQLLNSSENDYTDRLRIIRPDGSVRWLETIAKISRDEDGRALGMAGVNIDITERMQAEAILDRYRLLSDQSNEIIWFFRTDGVFVEVNRAAVDAYGYTREELLSMNIRDIRHSSSLGVLEGQLKAAQKGGVKYETIHVRKDGTTFPVEVNANVTKFGEEKLILAIVRDVTERKRADEQIRQSENRLRLVTNSMPALISYVGRDERYNFVNHTYTEWFRKPSDKLVGRKIREVVGAKTYREIKPNIDLALSGERVSFESTLHYKNAGTRFVHVSYVPDIGADGSVLGFYGLISDLSELKHSQELLRSSEERLGILMESFTDYAILSTDKKGKIVSWNAGAENIFGHKEAAAVGQSIEIIFTPEDVEHAVPLKEMRKAGKTGRASDDRWHMRKDGSRFFASGIMTPLYFGTELTGYAKILTDLTEKKRREEELQSAHDELETRVVARTTELADLNASLRLEIEERRAAEKEKVGLLKKVVTSQEEERRRIARDLHDQLGQRLTALRLKIASLSDFVAADPEVANRVARLQEIAERLDSEVSFLAWELRPSALDDLGLVEALRAFVKEWARHYETHAGFHANAVLGKRMRLETETHLYRITQEALNNVVKHAKATEVTVLLERQVSNLILIVEDNGIGFDPAKRAGVHKSGKGLGLIGMSERASLIGGEIEIESGVGKGTTIFVRVPITGSGK